MTTEVEANFLTYYSHSYQLDQSITVKKIVYFLFNSNFDRPFCKQCFWASDLGLYCLLMSNKVDARLWLKQKQRSNIKF